MEVVVVDAIARNINEALLFTTRKVIPRQRKKLGSAITSDMSVINEGFRGEKGQTSQKQLPTTKLRIVTSTRR